MDFRSDRLVGKGLLVFNSLFMKSDTDRHAVAAPDPIFVSRIVLAAVGQTIVVYGAFTGVQFEIRKSMIDFTGGGFLRQALHGIFFSFSVFHFRFPFLGRQTKAKAFVPPVLRAMAVNTLPVFSLCGGLPPAWLLAPTVLATGTRSYPVVSIGRNRYS